MALMTFKSDEARAKFRDILDEVTAGREVMIQRYEKPIGVLIPYDIWKSMKYAEALTEASRISERVKRGESHYTSGDEVMRQVLAQRLERQKMKQANNVGN